jgi:hypothetical protein
MLLLQCAIKMSDVGHTSKGPDNHRNWTERIMEEFFLQGDNEKELGVCGLCSAALNPVFQNVLLP